MDAKQLGSFLVMLRKEKNMTQKQLADKIHVTDKAISKWERGVGIPDITNLEALADALDVTVAELIQCKRQEEAFVKPEQVSELVNTTFDIAKYQVQITRRRMITGIIFAVIGAILILAGIYYLWSPVISVIGGADGPTSIFLAAKISRKVPAAVICIGGVIFIASLWKVFRKKR